MSQVAAPHHRFAPEVRTNPFVGLVPYTEDDAAWFFGRRRDRRIIAANLRAARLTVLYGTSGVGKSSVLLAAVVPDLRSLAGADRPPFALTVFSAWRDPPLAALMGSARASVVAAGGGEDAANWTPGEPLLPVLRDWTRRVRTLLLVLDQFEEHLQYQRESDGPDPLGAWMAEIVNAPDVRANLLLSLRDDAFSLLDRYQAQIPQIYVNSLRLDYLDAEAAREAICQPVAKYNEQPGVSPVTIEAPLVERVLHDVRTGKLALAESERSAPMADDIRERIETPFLQLVMERLWTAREEAELQTLSEGLLDRLGGAEAIASRHLDEAMAALTPGERQIAAELLGYLVTPSKTKIAQQASDLAFWTRRDKADVQRVVDALTARERRILRSVPAPEDAGAVERYEIFHDVLADAILAWRQQREQEQQAAARAEQLTAEHRELARRRRAVRRKRIRRVAIGALIAVLCVAAAVVLVLRARSEQLSRSRALTTASVLQLGSEPELSLLLALEALKERRTDEAEDALRRALESSRVRAAVGDGRRERCSDCLLTRTGAAAVPSAPTARTSAGGPVSFSPDGRRVFAGTGARAVLWNPVDGRVQRSSLPGDDRVVEAAFSARGGRLLVVGEESATVGPSDGGASFALMPPPEHDAALSADGRYVAGRTRGLVVVWDARRDVPALKSLRSSGSGTVAFDPRAPGVLAVAEPDRVRLWHWRAPGRRGRVVHSLARGAELAAFIPDDRRLIVVSRDGSAARLWDPRTGGLTLLAKVPRAIEGLAIDQRGRRVLLRADKLAFVRDLDAPRATGLTLAGHAEAITDAEFSHDGTLIATASEDGTARVWDTARGTTQLELVGHVGALRGVAFSANDRYVVTAGKDGTARLWDVGSGAVLHGDAWMLDVNVDGPGQRLVAAESVQRLHTLDLASDRTYVVAVDGIPSGWLVQRAVAVPGTGTVLVGAERPDLKEGEALLLDAATGRILSRPSTGASGMVDVDVTRDGRRALIVPRAAPPRVVELATGRRRVLEMPEPGHVTSGTLSRDGRRVLLTTTRGGAVIEDATTGDHVAAFNGHRTPRPEVVRSGAFSPNGRLAVTGGERVARVWDTRDGSPRAELIGHTGYVHGVSFSPDGRSIVTGGSDRTVRVWDTATGRNLAVLRHHADVVNGVTFMPDGKIASASDDGTVQIVPCETCGDLDALERLAARRVTRRPLSDRERTAYGG